MQTISELMRYARTQDCSDLHISEGVPACVRRYGSLMPLAQEIGSEESKALILSLLSDEQRDRLNAGYDLDFAYAHNDDERYRVNIYRHRLGLAAAIRVLRGNIPSLEELHLPKVLTELATKPNGLILVTGRPAAANRPRLRP